jgi:hypothetical protein
MFSTQSGPSPGDHQVASGTIYFTHPDGTGGTTGAEAIFGNNTITLGKHFFELYNYMNKKDYIVPSAVAQEQGLSFNYNADISSAFRYISHTISHEVTHWGRWVNNMPTNVTDASANIFSSNVTFAGFNGASPTWEAGEHYEFSAFGRTTSALMTTNSRMTYGAAVNIFYRTMATFDCSISGPPPANQSAITSAALRASLENDFQTLLYRNNMTGSQFGGYNPPQGNDVHGY